jgi:hypothetical protein
VHLPRLAAQLAKERAARVEPKDAAVAVAVRHEEGAVGEHRHVRGLAEVSHVCAGHQPLPHCRATSTAVSEHHPLRATHGATAGVYCPTVRSVLRTLWGVESAQRVSKINLPTVLLESPHRLC